MKTRTSEQTPANDREGERPRDRVYRRRPAEPEATAATLESDRVLLRAWREDDMYRWACMNADERVMQFFPSTYEEEYATQMARRLRDRLAADGYGWWVLEVKGVAPFAGVIALQPVPFAAAFTPALEIGWRLAVEHWGRGYATEGAELAARFAFDGLHLDQIVAMTAVQNLPSQRVMQRLGMTHDPRDDFDHPRLDAAHPLRRHVLFRLSAGGVGGSPIVRRPG